MNNRFTVIGLGQFGMSIALTLAGRGAEVIAIDNELDKVERVKEEVAVAVALDSTDAKALKAQNVQEVDAAVIAIGEDFESLVLTTVILQELKVKRIIARAANKQQRIILEKLGVEEILSPEDTVGKSVAETLLQPSIRSFLSLPDEYEIVEIDTPKRVIEQTVANIKLRQEFDLNLITVKRVYTEEKEREKTEVAHIIGVPRPDTMLRETDKMIILGKTKDIERFIECSQ
ncbi:trk system potassium uptake protein TrkA [Catalinimonas alkaloidigena]|uniref:potassium channel family protein n=1 Tax=Catalinimonas alkaloidigena TaxID=1075417 RepID=UPI0024075EE1|nr:TrkA family potassium uptake protein [Catalinimonas alkaloidigena]MDF9800202.1 trk system potassium uptake protein TrkA [Catalinimonas alkaloidigena]